MSRNTGNPVAFMVFALVISVGMLGFVFVAGTML